MKAKVTYVTHLGHRAVIGVVPFQWDGEWIMSITTTDFKGIYQGHWIEIIRDSEKFAAQKYRMANRGIEDE